MQSPAISLPLLALIALTLLAPPVFAAKQPGDAEDDPEIFAPPIDWYDSAPRANVLRVVSQVRMLLKDDWTSKTATAAQVVPRYVAVNELCPDDGRLPFAWGLFFWKVGERTKARSAFEKSVQQSPGFIAGHQAVAWASFELDQPDRGLASLESLWSLLQEPAEIYPSKNQKLQGAEWLGQSVGYLQSMKLTRPQTERLQELDRKLGLLPPTLREASARGRRASLDRAAELNAILALPPDQLQARFAADLALTKERLADYASRIAVLQRERDANANQAKSAQQDQRQQALAIRRLLQEIANHQATAKRLERGSYGKVVETKVPKYRREKQKDGSYKEVRDGYKIEKEHLPETPDETARRMRDIQHHQDSAAAKTQQRAGLLAQTKDQRKETNALTSEAARFRNTTASEWDALHARERELKQELSRIESWQTDPQKFAAYVRTVDPYVPWDVEVLREQLLESMTLTDTP